MRSRARAGRHRRGLPASLIGALVVVPLAIASAIGDGGSPLSLFAQDRNPAVVPGESPTPPDGGSLGATGALPENGVPDAAAGLVGAGLVGAGPVGAGPVGAGPVGAGSAGAGSAAAAHPAAASGASLPDAPSGATAIPRVVFTAYLRADRGIGAEQPGCRLSWTVLAGLGRVESAHAHGGRVDAAGTTLEPILGPRLDGGPGLAAVPDTERGALDGDPVWDRAVGPLQFLPSIWRRWGADGNGDGVASPHNVFDASLAAARYLCTGGGDLTDPDRLAAAVFRYHHSATVVRTVLAWARAYASGAEHSSGQPSGLPPDAAPPAATLAAAIVPAGPAPAAEQPAAPAGPAATQPDFTLRSAPAQTASSPAAIGGSTTPGQPLGQLPPTPGSPAGSAAGGTGAGAAGGGSSAQSVPPPCPVSAKSAPSSAGASAPAAPAPAAPAPAAPAPAAPAPAAPAPTSGSGSPASGTTPPCNPSAAPAPGTGS